MFEDGDLIPKCEDQLKKMHTVSDCLAVKHDDSSLQSVCEQHQKRWQAINYDIKSSLTLLEDLPQRWITYNKRFVYVILINPLTIVLKIISLSM